MNGKNELEELKEVCTVQKKFLFVQKNANTVENY